MPSQNFERELQVTADRARCWAVLTDVELLTSWVEIVHNTTEVAHLERYTAVLQDRVGPFSLRADLGIDVKVPQPERVIEVSAQGEDRQVGSRISVSASLRLDPAPNGVTVSVSGRYQVTGRVAGMGAGIIKKKADKILEEFFSHAAAELGGS
ncbi:MAG: CoxG family protein [Micromonosporaceae bacterium]